MNLREEALHIWRASVEAVLPGPAVRRVLEGRRFGGRVYMVAIGKAAYAMAEAAAGVLGDRLERGAVITKYGHAGAAALPRTEVFEAGHPVPDAAGVAATARVLALTEGLTGDDTVVLLISGGGSALFEYPLVPPEELADVNRALLACGADIGEINTIRKRLSAVKAGRFALHCAPAELLCVVLSDVLGDRVDVIASGPAAPDLSTAEEALAIAERYRLPLSEAAMAALRKETPKSLGAVETHIIGSVQLLCAAAERAAGGLGYPVLTLTHALDCEAREAGRFMGAVGRHYHARSGKIAILAGGETVVHLTGGGLGGRSQELALSAARALGGLEGILLLAAGSDGTDGPTDAAGGLVDGRTAALLREKGLSLERALADNDSYHALDAVGGLIRTGPTGTNVNDLVMLLIDPKR